MPRLQARPVLPVKTDPIDRRPLYLDARHATRICLDGPALRVDVEGQARRLYPLRRLSRVVANPHAQFTTEALLACAERGITLVFFNREGDLVGRLMGKSGPCQEIRQRLNDLLCRVDAQEIYLIWCQANEHRVISWVRRYFRIPPGIHRVDAIRQWLDQLTTPWAEGGTVAQTRRWMQALTRIVMIQHLQDLGLGADNELLQES